MTELSSTATCRLDRAGLSDADREIARAHIQTDRSWDRMRNNWPAFVRESPLTEEGTAALRESVARLEEEQEQEQREWAGGHGRGVMAWLRGLVARHPAAALGEPLLARSEPSGGLAGDEEQAAAGAGGGLGSLERVGSGGLGSREGRFTVPGSPGPRLLAAAQGAV